LNPKNNNTITSRKHFSPFTKHPHALAVRIFKERSPSQAKPRIIRTQLAWSRVFRGKIPRN
ncbi:MAG: hypothetical protein PVI98_07655, partial [Burkholderiales bacterium]